MLLARLTGIGSKAELTPFVATHKPIYHGLSSRAHQDFLSGALFGHMLQSEQAPAASDYSKKSDDTKVTMTLCYWTSAVIHDCIARDIGDGTPYVDPIQELLARVKAKKQGKKKPE